MGLGWPLECLLFPELGQRTEVSMRSICKFAHMLNWLLTALLGNEKSGNTGEARVGEM